MAVVLQERPHLAEGAALGLARGHMLVEALQLAKQASAPGYGTGGRPAVERVDERDLEVLFQHGVECLCSLLFVPYVVWHDVIAMLVMADVLSADCGLWLVGMAGPRSGLRPAAVRSALRPSASRSRAWVLGHVGAGRDTDSLSCHVLLRYCLEYCYLGGCPDGVHRAPLRGGVLSISSDSLRICGSRFSRLRAESRSCAIL